MIKINNMIKRALYRIAIIPAIRPISRRVYRAAMIYDSKHSDPVVVVDGGFCIKRSISLLRDPFGLQGRVPIYEPEVRQAIREILAEGGIAVDVGANIGYHTVLMSSLADQVIAIEPEPSNLELLKYNLKCNACENVEVVPHAISNVSKTTRLYLDPESAGSHSIVVQRSDEYVDVQCIRLDGILPPGRLRLLKMDIEGGEYDAILSLGDRLNDIDYIIYEHLSESRDPKTILLGFEISKLDEANFMARVVR